MNFHSKICRQNATSLIYALLSSNPQLCQDWGGVKPILAMQGFSHTSLGTPSLPLDVKYQTILPFLHFRFPFSLTNSLRTKSSSFFLSHFFDSDQGCTNDYILPHYSAIYLQPMSLIHKCVFTCYCSCQIM